ncbi:MAG: valine--tRNA ligase, partial [Sphingomonadaceae bacterium]
RQDLGREAFVERVWRWKAESGGQITRQLRRLGASCDWAHERFTMDEGFSAAVTRVFVELYRAGLLYRDKRLVNWDPKLKTAISDLEVETREVAGQLVHFSYPLADGSGHVTVATTRPETMLGDTAVAVSPSDERYAGLVGRMLRHPFDGREFPVVADAWADPEFGSGAVKITPAHDFNDFEVGKRHSLPMLNILDAEARVAGTGTRFDGLDRYEARKAVVAALEEAGLLEKIEEKTIQMPFGDRSGVVIEPWLTDQWYVNAAELAKAPMEAVRQGRTRFVPAAWEKTFFQWMENIQPWCVSRQLWWGHRIPAWHAPDGRVFVAESEEEARAQAGPDVPLERDPDVLDTWFSSALWPFGTLGWPEPTARLARHYPGDVLVTGFDIIFFWVARMQMMGHRFMGEVPFRTVYCHGLVRDAKGQKMSKSKGNTVDPLGLIDRYGADALRFFMAAMETQGRDIKLSEPRIEGYRNFATKLWNAARFAQGQGIGGSRGPAAPQAGHSVNRWIIAETRATAARLEAAMAGFRFDDYAQAIYAHVWDRFCDWYLELAKPLLAEGGPPAEETRAVAGWALDQILVMLHPVMPFISEELWHALAPRPHDLIVARWVEAATPGEAAGDAADEIDWLIRLVTGLRATRSELNVPQGARLPLNVVEAGPVTLARLEAHAAALARLARVEAVVHGPPPPGGAAQLVVDEATFALPLAGVIDLAAERARLEKARAQAAKEAAALEGRLANPGFLAKAAPEAVEKAREDLAARSAEAERLGAALARLG